MFTFAQPIRENPAARNFATSATVHVRAADSRKPGGAELRHERDKRLLVLREERAARDEARRLQIRHHRRHQHHGGIRKRRVYRVHHRLVLGGVVGGGKRVVHAERDQHEVRRVGDHPLLHVVKPPLRVLAANGRVHVFKADVARCLHDPVMYLLRPAGDVGLAANRAGRIGRSRD